MKAALYLLALLAAHFTIASPWLGSTFDDDDDDKISVPGENPFVYCDDPEDYIADIDVVDLDPNPPLAGKNLTISASGTLKKPVRRGTKAHVIVKYGLIKLVNEDIDICEQAEKVDKECPLKDDLEFETTVELPKAIPPGKYHVIANVTNPKDEIVTCLEADVEFKLPGSSRGGNELR